MQLANVCCDLIIIVRRQEQDFLFTKTTVVSVCDLFQVCMTLVAI